MEYSSVARRLRQGIQHFVGDGVSQETKDRVAATLTLENGQAINTVEAYDSSVLCGGQGKGSRQKALAKRIGFYD
jgi:hypothetical protein